MSRKPTTAKQIAANQRNAAKSTGPRTPRGRAASKMNALKHGILSREVLVRGRLCQESGEELEALHRRFIEDLQPEGPVEEMLVDQMVTAHWRLRRALTAEAGEIARGMDAGNPLRIRSAMPELQWMKWLALGDPVQSMERSATGNAILEGWLIELRKTVKTEGALNDASIQAIATWLGGKPNCLVDDLQTFRRSLEPDPEEPDAEHRERVRTETLAFLDRRIFAFQHQKGICIEEEDQEEESRRSAAMLPSVKVLDKILRYETKLERQIQRAMVQLERVQRMRRGETIPAPLSVDLSDRG